jgi:hypothetical protein
LAEFAAFGITDDWLIMRRGVKRETGAKNNKFERNGSEPTHELSRCRGWAGVEQCHQQDGVEEEGTDNIDL